LPSLAGTGLLARPWRLAVSAAERTPRTWSQCWRSDGQWHEPYVASAVDAPPAEEHRRRSPAAGCRPIRPPGGRGHALPWDSRIRIRKRCAQAVSILPRRRLTYSSEENAGVHRGSRARRCAAHQRSRWTTSAKLRRSIRASGTSGLSAG
jgi:hypothetical protein